MIKSGPTCSLSPSFKRRLEAFMSGTLLFTSPTCLQIIWWSINTIKLILNPSKYPSYFLSTRVSRAQGFYVYTKKFQGLIKMMEYHLCLLKISKASNVCPIIISTHAEHPIISLIKCHFRFCKHNMSIICRDNAGTIY